MSFEQITDRYFVLISELERIILDAETRVTSEPADLYFVLNVNFFTKSFLISLCCYLEAFLKEIANLHLSISQQRIVDAKVPHNLLTWSINREVKEKDLEFRLFNIALTSKEIDDELSGNPFRTAKCFRLLGINLDAAPDFLAGKVLVNSIVGKRNNIIHHNDTAGDITLGDIRGYCEDFKKYVRSISQAVIVFSNI